jgi:hypothetical protein
MSLGELNPPAMVQPAESMSQLIAEAKAMDGDLQVMERTCLTKALDLGRVLAKLKAICGHGAWLSTLAEIGIHPRRASDYIRLSKSDARPISECGSIREALEVVGQDGEEDQAPPLVPPTGPKQYCSRTCRVGQGPRNCKECAELRSETSTAGTEGSPSSPTVVNPAAPAREPGDDTDSEREAAKPRKRAEAAVGQIIRFLNSVNLLPKWKTTLEGLLKDIKTS